MYNNIETKNISDPSLRLIVRKSNIISASKSYLCCSKTFRNEYCEGSNLYLPGNRNPFFVLLPQGFRI